MQEVSDEELVRLAVHGAPPASEDAVNELFRRYQTRVALWCLRIAGDRDWAADLAQEVFLRAWRNLDSFREDAKFSTWLYTVARNHCFNALESRKARPEEPLDDLAVPDDADTRIDAVLEADQHREQMRQLVSSALDPTEARVMTLHYGEELTLDAITRLMGLTNASGAKAYIVSARRKLSTAVRQWTARNTRRGGGGGATE